MSRLRSCTMTDRTFILERKLQLCLCTKYSVCKTYTHCCLDICTLNRTIGLSLTAAATEHISEDISHIWEVKSTEAARTTALLECSMTILVILCTLLRIGQYSICLCSLFELFFRFFVSRVCVRVIFLRYLTVSFFQIRLGDTFCDSEDFIIISFIRHLHSPLLFVICFYQLAPRLNA